MGGSGERWWAFRWCDGEDTRRTDGERERRESKKREEPSYLWRHALRRGLKETYRYSRRGGIRGDMYKIRK